MVSCAISADGSYVTVANATRAFTLNLNAQGFAVTIGSQAGLINQGQNVIAIGNQAGVTNQSANSIILNTSGSVVNSYVPGFFVAPVASAGSSVSGSFAVLGYGTDSQVVQTGLTVLSSGFVGIGTNNPGAPFYLFAASTGLANGVMSVFSSSILSSTAGSYDIIQRWYESSSNASFVDLMWVRQSTGVDWQTASQRFQARTDAYWQGFIEFNGTNNNYGVTIGAGTSTSNPNSVPGVLYVKTGGLVGIGSATPTASLDVPGTTKFGILGTGITLGGANFKVAITADTNGYNPLAMGAYNDGYWCIAFYNSAGTFRGSIAGVNVNSISFNTTSDQRRKDNIKDMPSMISKIKALKPRSYTWKESGDKDDGFVAQEVHKVFPQFMTSAAAYCDICHHSYSDLYDGILCECCDFENPIGKDGTPHYYGLDYGKFTPYLTKALQETIEIVETQATQITALQAANATLQEENTQMKSQIASLLSWAQTQGFSG
jgi:hypothetical protein